MSGPVATARPPQALRQRRESQRPGVARTLTRPPAMDDDSAKPDMRRYVYTQQDILAKHKGKLPSLRVFLHPKHFRLNDSQETLSYASPMNELLQAIRKKEVPHNMAEDLYHLDTIWYDNCLIVEVHDYRSSGIRPKDDTNSTGEGGTSAFSIHNYNSFITPSPFAPSPAPNVDAKSAPAEHSKEDKENMPAPGQTGASHKLPALPKIRTVVLFPTPQSHLTDLQLLANTPLPDAASKRMQAGGRAAGMPPTPLTAVPPTPTFPTGPSPKRQKMILDDSNLHEFEAEVLDATCPKLYLEPTKSFAHSLALMDAMTHPNNKNPPPARKTRKRTTAELAADEAEAAGLQRFMLAGDGQQANMTATAAGNDDGAVRAAANSQTFSRFKTLASIKADHEEADRRKKEEDARLNLVKRQAQAETDAKKREAEHIRQQAELAERQSQQQQLLRQQAQQQAQLIQNQNIQNPTLQNEAHRAATQAQQMSNAVAAQLAQTPQSATQSHFSPVVRQHTPMNSAASPRVGGQASHPMGGAPMVATASNHAINSPARPPSAVSHHPMARSVSQQQNVSRTGTPQMVQGTPVMNASMPNRNMTPTPNRMSQGSPSLSMQGQTPMMIQTPQPLPGQNMTPEQMQLLQSQHLQNQQMQRLRQQHMLQQQQSMTPGLNQLQQLAVQKANAHMQQHGIPQGQNPTTYRQQLASTYFRQIQQQQQNQQLQQQGIPNASPQGLQQSGMPQQQPQQGQSFANMNIVQMRQHYNNRKAQLLQTYGQSVPPHFLQQMSQLEQTIKAREQQLAQQNQLQQINPAMQNHIQGQMNGIPNGQNPMQIQQYQQMLQQQRAAQSRQQQMLAMRQQNMQQGGQIPQGMMNNMQGMNMGNMNNMQAMQGMQGMNMGQMSQGMQGMQSVQGMNMGQMNQQQMQQMMIMRQAQQQAQQQAQRMGQQGQQGSADMSWSGV